ncbi:MAG: aminotransferase class V-fold PLP-dependent enzyme [Oscillospiraceae bacterium]|nr:aminotransferase class V-fold PLP-dependent enzyme [Oscillospiraceae bacterium]
MIYFDNASTSHPKAPGVAQAVQAILEHGCFNINRGSYFGAYEVSSMVFETRAQLAKLFDCPSGRNVVFTSGITYALNVALKGLLRPGDHVVTTQMEHNSVIRPLASLAKNGVVVDTIRCGVDGSLDLDDAQSKITDKTKLVVMTHASNVCGVIMPTREVGMICKKHGALLLVDSAQAAGVLPISMRQDHIDILTFAAHKGLLAAQGLGGIIMSQEIADMITPLVDGGTGSYTHIAEMPTQLPDKIEAGTLNLPGIAALNTALGYIEEIGIEEICKREWELMTRLHMGILELKGIRLLGPENVKDKCAIAALDFPDIDNAVVSARLDEQYSIMTRCGLHCAPNAHKALGTFPQGAVRVSVGHMNTEDEVDQLLSALAEIISG